MSILWNKMDPEQKPDMDTIGKYVNSSLWNELCLYLETKYQSNPVIAYSRCSGAPGWNVKYRKGGRGLCTLYPMEQHFTALVVIGERERTAVEMVLPFFTESIQNLYQRTPSAMGQKWLMIQVTEPQVLLDVKRLIEIRRPIK